MSAPFIALTMPAVGALDAIPIFVNATQIRAVYPARLRTAAGDFEINGTYVVTDPGDEGTFRVTEGYGIVAGAIRDALA